MALVAMDDCFRPKFNCVDGTDVGPTTDYRIRYTLSAFLAMVGRFVNNTAGFRVAGPLGAEATFEYNGNPPINLDSSPGGGGGVIWSWFQDTGKAQSNSTTQADFPGCPFIDGVAPPRESAIINDGYAINYILELDFFNVRVEQSFWNTATHVWLKFNITSLQGSYDQHYQCDGGSGGGPIGTIETNFIGIDYTTGPSIGAFDFSVPLGDGYMSAYFKDPGVPDKLTITNIETNG